jgi:hypothetical protein
MASKSQVDKIKWMNYTVKVSGYKQCTLQIKSGENLPSALMVFGELEHTSEMRVARLPLAI